MLKIKKFKKVMSVLAATLMVFSISGAASTNASAANAYSKTYSVKAVVKSYTAQLSAKITSTKLTASTYYESKAKIISTTGIAVRTDKGSDGKYNTDSEESTLTNVTGKTASISINSGTKKYSKGYTEHYIKTTADESSKTCTVYV